MGRSLYCICHYIYFCIRTPVERQPSHTGPTAFKIATADLIVGVANINTLGGTGFNSTNSFNLLNPAGTSLFTAPVPFYNVQFDEFNNTSQGVFTDPAGNFIAINQTSGGIDFNQTFRFQSLPPWLCLVSAYWGSELHVFAEEPDK